MRVTDSWVNLSSGIGDPSVDRRAESFPSYPQPLPWQVARNLYEGDSLAHRIVNTFPHTALSSGVSFESATDPDLVSMLSDHMLTPEFLKAAELALDLDRAFGGCLLWPAYEGDATDLLDPPPTGFPVARWFPVEPAETAVLKENRYSRPLTYMIAVGREIHDLHYSRVVRLDGVNTSPRTRLRLHGWGLSVLQRPYDLIRDAGISFAALSIAIEDSTLITYKLSGLVQAMGMGREQDVRDRVALVERHRSARHPAVIDTADELIKETSTYTGLSDLFDRLTQILSMATGIPVTILMGRSPAGMNATGDSDFRAFYKEVSSYQTLTVSPFLMQCAALAARSWRKVLPLDLKVVFPPLWEPTESESAEIYQKRAAANVAYVQAGILDPSEVRAEEEKRGNVSLLLDVGEAAQLADLAMGAIGASETTPVSSSEPQANKSTPAIEFAPTDLGKVITANEMRRINGLPPLVRPDGTPDPSADLPLAEFAAAREAAATAAGEAAGAAPQSPQGAVQQAAATAATAAGNPPSAGQP